MILKRQQRPSNRRRGLRAGPLVCVVAASITLLSGSWTPPPSRQPRPATFADILDEYRHGDADRAVQILSTWTDRQIDRDAKLPLGQSDAWSKAALALLLVEARSGIPTSAAKAESLIAQAYDHARTTQDRHLLTFCRDWYFAALTSHANLAMDAEAELSRRFQDDPLAQLELGKKAERFLEVILHPDRDGYALGYRHDEIHGTSSHGPYGEDAARAEHAYRQALILDSGTTEARLRLGRVLWFVDRRDDAERELKRAAAEAKLTNAVALAYLANLFLGQLDEETGKLDAARESYEEAIHINPAGQVARLALGQLLLATGREVEGWSVTFAALDRQTWEGLPPDPWRVYLLDDTNWSSAGRFAQLRSRVRRP